MPKEVEFQTGIIRAAKEQGGYGRKWSSQFQIGCVDLVLHLPKAGAVFMEVKKEVGSKFARKITTSPKQRHELSQWEKAGALSVVAVVADGGARDRWLWLLPWHTERLDTWHPAVPHTVGKWPYGGLPDLEDLVARYKDHLFIHGPQWSTEQIARINALRPEKT